MIGGVFREVLFQVIMGCNKLRKQFNDILGLRFVIKKGPESPFDIAGLFEQNKKVSFDCKIHSHHNDGYKGVHLYIKKNSRVFPIEIQIWTRQDALLNRYLRDNVYTKSLSGSAVLYARSLREWLDEVPELPENEMQSYIDYLYEKAFA